MSRGRTVAIGAATVVVVLVGVGVWWFLRDDAPPPVDLDTAAESVERGEGEGAAGAPGVEGTWTVDTETGEFDYESATGTFAGFRVEEELAGVGSATAVGRTGDVSGSMTIEGTELTAATFEVDMTTITTNESRRDDRVQQALETDRFPTATFTLTAPVDLGDAATDGDPVSVAAPGELTVHGVTEQVEFPLEARLVDSTVVVVGSLEIVFSDHGVEVPSSPVVVSADDHGIVELQILLTRG